MIRVDHFYRFAVLIPENSIFPEQIYDQDHYQLFHYSNWRQTLKELDNTLFDEVVVLGQFVTIPNNLLSVINIANNDGYKAIQLHSFLSDNSTYKLRRRTRKEELRNGFLKSGRCGVNLSSAMDKINFVLPLKWTQDHLKSEKTNIEWLLTAHRVFIKYLSEPLILVNELPAHCKQRPFMKSMKRLFIHRENKEEVERSLAHLFPSFKQLIYILIFLSIITSIFQPAWSIKWWISTYVTFFAYSIAMPNCAMIPHKQRKNHSLYKLWKNRKLKTELSNQD
jgi:hypothetical protein